MAKSGTEYHGQNKAVYSIHDSISRVWLGRGSNVGAGAVEGRLNVLPLCNSDTPYLDGFGNYHVNAPRN